MFRLTDQEMLASIGMQDECYFYPRRIDKRCKTQTMTKLLHEEMFSELPVGSSCVFFVKGMSQVWLMTGVPESYRFEVLSEETSKPYLALEWFIWL